MTKCFEVENKAEKLGIQASYFGTVQVFMGLIIIKTIDRPVSMSTDQY